MIQNKKGKLIVIEGSDGSGKTVQTELLVNYLNNKNLPVKYFDFPQYHKNFYVETLGKMLRGEFGDIDEISPYFASLIYALDRTTVKKEIKESLNKGEFVITNRYIPSNMAHQGAKFKDPKERNSFLGWVNELEYKIHKLPKEDIVIYLYVPLVISQKLIEKKVERDYLKGKKDIHEKDLGYLKETEKMYLLLANTNKNWVKINCVENGKLLSKEKIHQKILIYLDL